MSFWVMEIENLRSPLLFDGCCGYTKVRKPLLDQANVDHLPTQGQPRAIGWVDGCTRTIGNTQIGRRTELKFDKPIGMVRDRETKLIPIER